MAKKLTDDVLREYLRMEFSQTEIARLFGISDAAVSKRVAKMERGAVAQSLTVAVQAVACLWDVRAASEENYKRALANYETCENRTAAIGEIRNHIKLGMDVLMDLYRVEEVKAFQEEVLTILDEFDPTARERILARIRERRAVRGAFTGSD